jgi:hypothetical protein
MVRPSLLVIALLSLVLASGCSFRRSGGDLQEPIFSRPAPLDQQATADGAQGEDEPALDQPADRETPASPADHEVWQVPSVGEPSTAPAVKTAGLSQAPPRSRKPLTDGSPPPHQSTSDLVEGDPVQSDPVEGELGAGEIDLSGVEDDDIDEAGIEDGEDRNREAETYPPDADQAGAVETEPVEQLAPLEQDKDAATKVAATVEGEVEPAAPGPRAEEVAPRDWHDLLGETIAALERDSRRQPETGGDVADRIYLGMFYLAAGDRQGAVRPAEGLPAGQREFWRAQLNGLATYLDAQSTPDVHDRATQASRHLHTALARLSELGRLQVHNLTFCTRISSYGVVTPFAENRFQAGTPVLLYTEVENFTSEASEAGYRTALQSSYVIADAGGRRVSSGRFDATEETCRNPRRDYFVGYRLTLPEDLQPGDYVLNLSVEDLKGHKTGHAAIDFSIVPQ